MTGEMNAFLAELYGTGNDVAEQVSHDDVEKLAQAEILDQVLQQDGLTLDDLSGEQILKVAESLFGADNEIAKMAEAEAGESEEEYKARMKKEKGEESSEEKVAEADFLGRVMAHSFWNEKSAIEKEAVHPAAKGLELAAQKGLSMAPMTLSKAPGARARRAAGAVHEAVKGLGEKVVGRKRITQAVRKGEEAGRIKGVDGGGLRAKERLRAAAGYGTVGGGTALAGGGTYAATRGGKKKKASAFDALAEERALEILAENGYEIDDGQDKLASAVEERAWEMLAENGYLE